MSGRSGTAGVLECLLSLAAEPKADGPLRPVLVKKPATIEADERAGQGRMRTVLSGRHRLEWHRTQVGELAEVVGGSCEGKSVTSAAGAA
jgi:hypothetical protein